MNWANRLTIARLFLTLAFVAALSTRMPYGPTIGLLLFIIAGITDFVDGYIARRYNLITDFGKLMDPLIDKIMMAAAFILLVSMDAIPAWVAIIIISREFLITGLRMLAITSGRVLAAEKLGKHKTAWQIATAIFFLTLLAWKDWSSPADRFPWWDQAWTWGGTILLTVATIFTVWSGLGYLWKNRALVVPG